ncbi:hypothetical protein DPMN_071198 [Dreissena polymorpha]|uniref:C-type lectin domain-containing protein n=1 Tax=Dreissena polymorpha TaxID=45954 RepID=A0A9D4BW23_DREPO|nr:hypothetical protein DPMN_071198 [Dreissena polymorpha]
MKGILLTSIQRMRIVSSRPTQVGIQVRFGVATVDLMAENHFLWIDDNTEAIFTDRGQDQPNGGIEDCIVLDHKDVYRWHDYHCETQMFPLCEAKPTQIQIVGCISTSFLTIVYPQMHD